MKNLKGKTIFLVKVGDSIIEKTLNLNTAKATMSDYNFEIMIGLDKARLFKATIK